MRLTFDQCKKLKEWGMDQYGQYFYEEPNNPPAGYPGRYKYMVEVRQTMEREGYTTYKSPDLKELLEFAQDLCLKKKTSNKFLGIILFSYCYEKVSQHYHCIACFMVHGKSNGNYGGKTDPSPEQAVYNLIEKIMEVA